MNFGRSRNARQAIAEGRGPASLAAAKVGCGCTAAWVLGHVTRCEWHHVQANLGGDGRPTNFYATEDVLASWLAANWHAARAGDKTAARRLPALRRLRREMSVEACRVGEALRETPAPVARVKVAVEIAGNLWVKRRSYSRERGRYVPVEEIVLAPAAEWRGEWLAWQGGRCLRKNVIETFPASAADLAHDEARAEHYDRCREAAERREADLVATRKATRAAEEASLIARYRAEPTPGRAQALRQYRLCPAAVMMEVA